MSQPWFDKVTEAPLDPILGITVAFNNDTSPNKVNLGVGAYRDNNGKPWVLDVVRNVEKEIAADEQMNHEYIPIEGLPAFRRVTAPLVFGQNASVLKENRVATTQSLSGTGALRIGFAFVKTFFPADLPPVLISDPTWGNHKTIVQHCGLQWKEYPYYDEKTNAININGFLNALRAAPPRSIILLHPCAHNPTGVDPTQEQWKQIAAVMREKDHFPFFDSAYQGFATGDLERDAFAIRYFVDQGFELFVTQSYAKNFGLYGERIGALNVVCKTSQQADFVLSQLKIIIRAMYSTPPKHGAAIVARVLGEPALRAEWERDLKLMANRIMSMRTRLFNRLKENGTPGTWNHIVDQIGMFSYTGLNAAQCKVLTEKWHIYLVNNGRISMAGLNDSNVNYVADAIKDAVMSTK